MPVTTIDADARITAPINHFTVAPEPQRVGPSPLMRP
jgi:hypothetical protein